MVTNIPLEMVSQISLFNCINKAAAEKFCIGFAGPASVEWAGEITGIKIYNKALTQAEVLQNYNDQKDRFGL